MGQNIQGSPYPEIWGGIECTIARIGDRYHDQLEASGHYQRVGDISRLADLGISAIRYPLLWERHQPARNSQIDWTWPDRQLRLLRKEHIIPIIGLLHHGSGPGFTDLSQPGFAEDLAAYAGLIAARYPWIDYYTPVNEPLTTARFSGLYGVWYPHRKDDFSFITMLLNQVKGVICAMKAIRRINPAAKLVQTEDLSFIHSSPSLAYQAAFENCRRWLSFDLLCGRVDNTHPLWPYLLHIGVPEADLSFFTSNPCPPDILGLNYYVTSERYLDEEITNYPAAVHGGNGRDTYADVAAARVTTPKGLLRLINEAWDRYHLPIAVTETHINCTREQQLRWLKEVWEAACEARRRSIDVRAVTSWALFGAYDWDSLLTAQKGNYEPGAYRIENGVLKLTAVGVMIRSLAISGTFHHPLLDLPGWWHSGAPSGSMNHKSPRPLLIVGDPGSVNAWFDISKDRGIVCRALTDFSKNISLMEGEEILNRYQPWAVILAVKPEGDSIPALSAACRLVGLRMLERRDLRSPSGPAMQHALDLLIDDVMRRMQSATIDQLHSI